MSEPMGPRELRKRIIQSRGMEEEVRWVWWTVCKIVGHDFRDVPDHAYILRCERCGRLNPIRRPDE
jgi:hypothetical protein